MSYENCPFDDVNIVMVKGASGDIVRPSDPEFQELVAAYILDNPDILNSPSLETAISDYVRRTQTVYSNEDFGQTFAVCEGFTSHSGANVVMLSENIQYGFPLIDGGILAIKFPYGIPEGFLEIRLQNECNPVIMSEYDGGGYEFKGFEISPGDVVTFMCILLNNNYGFVMLGTNRPSAGVMEDGRIWNKYLPKPDSLFMTTEGTTNVSYPENSDQLRTIVITGTGPAGVKSYPLFIDITNEAHAPTTIASSIRGYGITSRSEGADGVGSFIAEAKVNIPTSAPVNVGVNWKVLWYIYG